MGSELAQRWTRLSGVYGMSPSPKDMPRRLPLHQIFRAPKEEDPKPEWAEDLRWKKKDIYAHIRPYINLDGLLEDGSPDPRNDHTEVLIEVRFGGTVFHSKQWVHEKDKPYIPELLTIMVDSIDRMMEEHGFPPYEIRSTDG